MTFLGVSLSSLRGVLSTTNLDLAFQTLLQHNQLLPFFTVVDIL